MKTQTKSLYTIILETEDVCIKYYVIFKSIVHCLSGWLNMVPQGTRASYYAAKRNARHAGHHARQEADKVYENIDPKSAEVYRLANQFRRKNTDVVGDKHVKNDAGEMSMSEDSTQKAWLEHYQRLLNVDFDWDPDHLSYQSPMEGPAHPNHH